MEAYPWQTDRPIPFNFEDDFPDLPATAESPASPFTRTTDDQHKEQRMASPFNNCVPEGLCNKCPPHFKGTFIDILKANDFDGSRFHFIQFVADTEEGKHKADAEATLALLLKAKALKDQPIVPPAPPQAAATTEGEPATVPIFDVRARPPVRNMVRP